jgi:hypothetical protein
MNSDSDSDSERLAPRQQRTVFDHIRAMKPAAIDRLYGKVSQACYLIPVVALLRCCFDAFSTQLLDRGQFSTLQ